MHAKDSRDFEFDRLHAEIKRLRTRNEALLGLIEVAYCPVNGKARVRDCQQCGCSAGLLLKDEPSQGPTK